MLVLTVALAMAFGSSAPSAVLLLAAAGAIGVVDAFYLPASGAMPRHLVPRSTLARALAVPTLRAVR